MLNLGVDVFERSDFDAMRNAILLRKATGIDQATLWFHIAQRKTEIDARARGWLNLCKDMFTIEGNYGLTGTSFRISADAQAELCACLDRRGYSALRSVGRIRKAHNVR